MAEQLGTGIRREGTHDALHDQTHESGLFQLFFWSVRRKLGTAEKTVESKDHI